MLAARYLDRDTSLSVTQISRPVPGPGELRIDLEAASICGTDLHYLDPTLDYTPDRTPITLGHEGAGRVAATGDGVERVIPGDRVAVNYVIGCGRCRHCTAGFENRCLDRSSVGHDVDGTFAESIVLPERAVAPLGSSVPFDWGSLTSCAVSTAYHAINRAGPIRGRTVLVTGAGGVGLSTIMWADVSGAADVIAADPIADQRRLAERLGADLAIDPDPESADPPPDDLEADVEVAIECSGSEPAMDYAIAAVAGDNEFASGTVVSVGLQETPIEVPYWGLREGTLRISGDHTRSELREIVRLLDRGRVDLDPLLTHRVALEDIEAGIETLRNPDGPVGRVVVEVP